MKRVIIIGGGLSGLITSIKLANAGILSTVIEKKNYPFHRVCGEYISNETVPFLKSLNLFPEEFAPPAITRFQLTSVNGKSTLLSLPMGGFGISRYTFDHFLYQRAINLGVNVMAGTEVEKVSFSEDTFEVRISTKTVAADVVIGTFGKRSRLDVTMGRSFIKKRSPYVAVKYHIITSHPADLIALHNFRDGYCGISNIEHGKTNLCYLSHRDNLKEFGNIQSMEEAILFRNPFLKDIFKNSRFIFDKPETINEISFETKAPVEGHILMGGDAAGMITPLCGNGMAMAIRSSSLLGDLLIRFCSDDRYSREKLEEDYSTVWKSNFQTRLWTGRQIQRLFGNEWTSNLAVNLANSSPLIATSLIRRTHGSPF